MAGAINTIGQSKRGGGDRSSRSAQLQARENEQKALSLWIKGATFQQIAAAGFGIASASGAWRAVHRGLAQIPEQEADQAHRSCCTLSGDGAASLDDREFGAILRSTQRKVGFSGAVTQPNEAPRAISAC
jgi:hypothetical protein